ncbi:Glycosyltransferase family 1 [uncultured virus]|nr:Glycosyltransferase family 1 [uncultured virus]
MNLKKYIIVTNWAYPFGGGEEYLLQTMEWCHKYNIESYWITFSTADNRPHTEFDIVYFTFGTFLKIPGGFNVKVLYNWLKLLKPDIVHHQGMFRKQIYEVCKDLRIQFLSGYHFWSGAIILSEKTKNINILENSNLHKTDEELIYIFNQPFCNLYCASDFVQECIHKITKLNVNTIIYPVSSTKKCKILENNILENQYITMINIHKLKGGELFLYLIENLNLPFLAIKTENFSDELDNQIKKAIDERNYLEPKCLFFNRIDDPKEIYKLTRILIIPSIVDETFCRVANEGMMNGIPIITTGNGFIKDITKECAIFIPFEDKSNWINTINDLYFNPIKLTNLSKKTLEFYENFSENKGLELFKNKIDWIFNKSKENNVMIFCPWCDQGLGIQARNYYNILKKNNINVFIFSYKPYMSQTNMELQKNPEEWYVEHIYYSSNDREHINNNEIKDFVIKFNIGRCLLPETCWFRVFEISELLKQLNIKVFAIPNIEIVRKKEIFKHRYFYKILCNNRLCEKLFKNYQFNNLIFIGFSFYHEKIFFKIKKLSNEIKFLFIGGMNAFERKNILKVCRAFEKIHQINNQIKLTCLVQDCSKVSEKKINKLKKYLNNPNISLINRKFSFTEIINFYYDHHICIQVSKHEGLGLGFYESLATGTPVLTLDTSPHNEIIIENKTGWLIPCYEKPMKDNNDSLLKSASFDPFLLSEKILEIATTYNSNYENIFNELKNYYTKELCFELFEKRFVDGISG